MDVLTLVKTLIAGTMGTTFMSLTMAAIHTSGWANADMVRAVGSLLTRRREGAFVAGLGLHFTAGMMFALPYTWVLGAFSDGGFVMTMGLGLLLGLVHGIVMALALVAVGSPSHPLKEFRDAGFEVGVAHILGHVAYGIGVALMVEALGIRWS